MAGGGTQGAVVPEWESAFAASSHLLTEAPSPNSGGVWASSGAYRPEPAGTWASGDSPGEQGLGGVPVRPDGGRRRVSGQGCSYGQGPEGHLSLTWPAHVSQRLDFREDLGSSVEVGKKRGHRSVPAAQPWVGPRRLALQGLPS